jgi:hypothetical protein
MKVCLMNTSRVRVVATSTQHLAPALNACVHSGRSTGTAGVAMFVFVLLHPIFTSANTDPSGTEVALKQARDEANRGWWYETGQ